MLLRFGPAYLLALPDTSDNIADVVMALLFHGNG